MLQRTQFRFLLCCGPFIILEGKLWSPAEISINCSMSVQFSLQLSRTEMQAPHLIISYTLISRYVSGITRPTNYYSSQFEQWRRPVRLPRAGLLGLRGHAEYWKIKTCCRGHGIILNQLYSCNKLLYTNRKII
jgi:hypothetical protein